MKIDEFNVGDEVWIIRNRDMGMGVSVAYVVKGAVYCKETRRREYKNEETTTHVDYHVEYTDNGEIHDDCVYDAYPTKEEAQRNAYDINEHKVKFIENKLKRLNEEQEKLNAN